MLPYGFFPAQLNRAPGTSVHYRRPLVRRLKVVMGGPRIVFIVHWDRVHWDRVHWDRVH